jgi:multidrug efflux pump subunit AcrA (membrane-fusion protein)
MSMQVLGRIKFRPLGSLVLALFLVLGSLETGYALEEHPANPSPPPPAVRKSEIVFNGKLFCSLKRLVNLPFKGTIMSLRVTTGQRVKAGEILTTYKLAPEAVLTIQQRLFPAQISETEGKLADLNQNLVPLRSKQKELRHLAQNKLAPPQSLAQSDQQLKFMEEQKGTLQTRLQQDRKLARQDREVLSQLLGTSLKSGQVPREVSLKAPINGYVILVNPNVRVGAELPPLPAAFEIGVMNPMVVRAQAFEIEAMKIKVGDRAEVTLTSLPGRKFAAVVSRISWSPITSKIDQPSYYEVELKVPNPDLALREGLKVRIVILKSKQK